MYPDCTKCIDDSCTECNCDCPKCYSAPVIINPEKKIETSTQEEDLSKLVILGYLAEMG